MEQNKKNRKVLRTAFTKGANELEQSMMGTDVAQEEVQVLWEMLQQKYETLINLDQNIYDTLLTGDTSEEELLQEIESRDNYQKRFTCLRVRCQRFLKDELGGPLTDGDQLSVITSASENATSAAVASGKRKFRLPKIEFKKFDGSVREWLSFWAQFGKIHEDPDIDSNDKIQYLIQATVPNSRARRLVESFPAISDNYEKIIDSIKTRFGREDLQIEVYVRELLKVIINNANAKEKLDISVLYDKIETQIRALETLGVTSDKCSAMLFPLIESCLPEELLRVWQRSIKVDEDGSMGVSGDTGIEKRLKALLRFLRNEVDNEQRISLAAESFGFAPEEKRKFGKSAQKIGSTAVPTAAGLINSESAKCVFCGGSHSNESCFKSHKMSLEQKKAALTAGKTCFRCLRVGHTAKRCRTRLKCIICGESHVVLMCTKLPAHTTADVASVSTDTERVDDNSTEQNLANRSNPCVLLQTLRVTVKGPAGSKEVRALIDSGSQRSYILKSTAQELGYLPKRVENILHGLFGGSTVEQKHNCYDVSVRHRQYVCKFEVFDQAVICQNIPSVLPGPWMDELQEMGIQVLDKHGCGPIEILIGADVAGKLYTGDRKILSSGLVAVDTLLGWTLMGKVPYGRPDVNAALISYSLLLMDTPINNLWELDVLGITDPTEQKSRLEMTSAAKDFFVQTVRIDEEGRYEVMLPWLEGHPPLPQNYSLAKNRLDNTLQKLRKLNLLEDYDSVLKEWLQEGIIEQVAENLTERAHYLPHRPVIKKNSTTRIRPVFDASAKEKCKPSLNQCLEKGLNLIELIPTILLRFREYKLGVVADIRKAFLQISVNETDRDFLRFLWIDSEGNERKYRHRRVVFGVNSSPFLLGATIEHHLLKCFEKCGCSTTDYSTDTILKLLKSFYVDNCLTSVPNAESLKQFIQEASTIMSEAKFDLRGWEFTGSTVDRDNALLSVLGLTWDLRKDQIMINPECFVDKAESEDKGITKRLMLSIAQRVFDPIGFSCPATLKPKLLLQQTWKNKLSWDAPVDIETDRAFRNWRNELPYLQAIHIPRWIGFEPGESESATLHTFCDASVHAYSAVVFLTIEKDGNRFVHLLAAKARVAPLRRMSIPRLELLAATIGARLYNSVQSSLEHKVKCLFWSDSSTVISWINREEEWGAFVWNRIAEIRGLTPTDAWRHVPGSLNPADLPSRGCSPKQLFESRWWEGPKWLYEPEDSWPYETVECDEEEIYKERKKKLVSLLEHGCHDWHFWYFSKYYKIIRMMAWILRFAHNAKMPSQRHRGSLSADELDRAEIFVICTVQRETFAGKEDERIKSLNPFYDELHVIRLKTRVVQRNDSENFRFPILLPANHLVVDRLIMHYHERSCHVGVQGLLSLLREKYWILGGRRTIRKVVSKCITCRKQTVKPCEVESPPLPLDRVRDACAFEISGVDFAGPLFLKNGEKAWVCIFTCAVYRAVHLELTSSLSTPTFLQVLRRFISRRGRPKIVYSDNGTNFVGTENAFSRLNWKTILEFTSVERIKWRFNPPSAPWWGGFWERLIGVLKPLLRKVLGRASLSYEELMTLICDCEAVLNARPLTYVSNDPGDLEPLTPAMFLRDLNESGVPDCDEVDRAFLCRKAKYRQKLRDDLRRRFRNEYLGQLKSLRKKQPNREVCVGEVVLVGNDNTKRLDWPIGRVTELLPGVDGKIRLVRVTTARGQLLRPIQRIYPLECVDVSTPGPHLEENREAEFDSPTYDQQVSAEVSRVKPDQKSRVPEVSAGVSKVKADHKSRASELKITRSGRVSVVPRRFR